jgi:hypothetical protein
LACAIRRERVESTCFTEVGYNRDFRTLEVQFQPRAGSERGETWRIFGVSVQRFNAFLRAQSLGAYFNQRIRRMAGYDASRVAPAV